MADGSRHSVYIVEETVYGVTPNDPALQTMRTTGCTLGLAKDSLQSQEIRDDRQIMDFRLGADKVAGDIPFEMGYGTYDALLVAVLMGATWAADTPAVGTDQIKAGTTRRSFTVIRKFDDLSSKKFYVYRGLEVNQLALSIAANAMITGTFSFIGKSMEILEDLSSLGTPTFVDPTTTTPMDSFTGALTIDGAVNAVVTELTLTLQNGLDPRFVVGSATTIRPSVQSSNLTGQMTSYFEESAQVERFINEVETSLEFTLPDVDGNALKIIVPRVKYTGGQPDVSGPGSITLPLPFQALGDSVAKTNITIERTPA